jgi:arylsulfatase A-like enzyme
VIVLDACLEGLLEVLSDSPTLGDWIIVLCGVRGFPLGEHGRVGGVDERLFVEQLHVPLVWRFPDGSGRMARASALASHCDVTPTLLDWLGDGLPPALRRVDGTSLVAQIRQQPFERRSRLIASSANGCRSLRTDDWTLRCEPADASTAAPDADAWHRELYVRPDDRWEANDVAGLCLDVVDELSELLCGPENGAESNRPDAC